MEEGLDAAIGRDFDDVATAGRGGVDRAIGGNVDPAESRQAIGRWVGIAVFEVGTFDNRCDEAVGAESQDGDGGGDVD